MASRGTYADNPLIIPPDQVSFDSAAFDNIIEYHGVMFKHWKAIPCTGGDIDKGSMRSTHLDHTCSNGFYFKGGRCFLGVFDNNQTKKHYKAEGIIDSSMTTLHVPRYYANGSNEPCDHIYFYQDDKLELEDESVVVPKWEKLQCSPTGIDRAMFPIVWVEYVVDAYGNEYTVGSDFEVLNGNIHWLTNHRPQFNPAQGTGGIYSVRYLYRPSWYIAVVLHEVRLVNTFDPVVGVKTQIRYPQLLFLQREIYFLDQLNRANGDSPQEGIAPSSGMNLSIK